MLKVYAVRDKAVGAFMAPFFVRSPGEAMRSFVDAVNDKNTPFFRHPGDFELYDIGMFDPSNGSLSAAECVRVASALEVVEPVA